MSKIIYIDCSSGISGDIFLASFIDAGFDINILKKEFLKLRIKGYKLAAEEVRRHHISATRLNIIIDDNTPPMKPRDIVRIITKSSLDPRIKKIALAIFDRICIAERKVHKNTGEVHLHELGSIDTILDVVGAAVLLVRWEVEKVYFSNVNLGSGVMKGRHSMFPVPAPATAEILKGIPVMFSDIKHELVTPTGAAIIRETGIHRERVQINTEKIGYGAGSKDIDEIPNALRLIYGEEKPDFGKDRVVVIECAIDDMPGVVYTYLYDRLFEAGALDVYITPIQMKKNRPAQLVTVVSPEQLVGDLAGIIFEETTTIGVRYYTADRLKLDRKIVKVKTKYGTIETKQSGANGRIYKVTPEFESCLKAAKKSKIPLLTVIDAVKKTAAIFLLALGINCANLYADTIFIKDGSEMKGIVVEEYKDRIVLSTEEGEKTIMREDVTNIAYDLEEQNLVAMADKMMKQGDYDKAYYYYEKARKINPDFKDAIDGANYVLGYKYRKETTKKIAHVKWSQTVDDFNSAKQESAGTEEGESFNAKLKKEIGLELDNADEKVVVKYVYEGTPANKAGLRKGDIISSIWGKLAGYMTADEIARQFLKAENLEMKIQIDRTVNVKKGALQQNQMDIAVDGAYLKNIKTDTAAYKAGLRDDDIVLAVDGKSIRYTPLKDVQKLLGKANRKMTVRRDMTIWTY